MPSHDPFDDFADSAAELFGLDENEAADLLVDLGERYGFELGEDALEDYAPEAVDLLPELEEEDELDRIEEDYEEDFGGEEEYELDPTWVDDEWLEADSWYEVTAEYKED